MTAARPLHVRVTLPLDRFELAVDLVTRERVTGVFGASGSGKTSLLEAVAGLRRSARGTIRLGDETWLDSGARVAVPPERRAIGYVPQDGLLFPHLSVEQNLLAGSARATAAGIPVAKLLAEVVATLRLAPLLSQDVRTLSGGERQRVALGRALCSGPRLLLLDEPFASLDVPLRRKLLPFLARVRDEFDVPMLLVSHDPIEVQALCDDVVVLADGAIVARGAPRAVLTLPRVLPLAGEGGFESVLPGVVVAKNEDGTSVRLGEGALLEVPAADAAVGARLFVGIPARDVILASSRPTGLSARNVLPATIVSVRELGAHRLVLARVADDAPEIAVEVTAGACAELGVRPGAPTYLVIKTSACVAY